MGHRVLQVAGCLSQVDCLVLSVREVDVEDLLQLQSYVEGVFKGLGIVVGRWSALKHDHIVHLAAVGLEKGGGLVLSSATPLITKGVGTWSSLSKLMKIVLSMLKLAMLVHRRSGRRMCLTMSIMRV